MTKQVFINLPVSDVAKSTAFYEKLGFTKNPTFSSDKAASMMWSDQIVVMLLAKEFYQTFLKGKSIADTKATSSVLLAITLDSKEAVQQFAETAKANGGDYYQAESDAPEEMMFGLEVSDPDGNGWEPIWMSPDFKPQG
jgi:hypothetical protein